MRFLADECCRRPIVVALRIAGHDVVWAAETASGFDDEMLLGLAQSEDRIFITDDLDFGDLVVRRGLRVPGLILLRYRGAETGVAAERLVRLVERAADRLGGHIAVVEMSKVRFRPISA